MADNESRGRRRRKKKKSVLYTPISFIIICAAMAFGMSVFFKVSVIEVIGIGFYSDQEIIEASGIEEGDNLFFINKSSATSNVYAKLPYVELATITRRLPNKIVIDIKESASVAYIISEGKVFLLDHSCKILESAGLEKTDGLILVKGITPLVPLIGDLLKAEEDDISKVEYLSDILGQIESRGMISQVKWIDVSNIGSPSFEYTGRFTVRLGKNENLEYKFEMLLKATQQLKEGDSGTIDLSNEKKAQFSPG